MATGRGRMSWKKEVAALAFGLTLGTAWEATRIGLPQHLFDHVAGTSLSAKTSEHAS